MLQVMVATMVITLVVRITSSASLILECISFAKNIYNFIEKNDNFRYYHRKIEVNP